MSAMKVLFRFKRNGKKYGLRCRNDETYAMLKKNWENRQILLVARMGYKGNPLTGIASQHPRRLFGSLEITEETNDGIAYLRVSYRKEFEDMVFYDIATLLCEESNGFEIVRMSDGNESA